MFFPDGMHYLDCEDQPEGFPCICEQLRDKEINEMADVYATEGGEKL